MTLIARFARLFQADLHAVLDRIEEPAAVLRQAVREMEDDLARDRRRLARLRDEQRQRIARRGEIEQALRALGEALDTCFALGKDDLARGLIRRRLEAERSRALHELRHAEAEETLQRLAARVQDKEARREAMRQKAELLAPDAQAGAAQPWDAPSVSVRDEDVEVAFLREQQRRAGR
jgi:phage shock protein A